MAQGESATPFKHVIWRQDNFSRGQERKQQLIRARVVFERLLQDGDLLLCNCCL